MISHSVSIDLKWRARYFDQSSESGKLDLRFFAAFALCCMLKRAKKVLSFLLLLYYWLIALGACNYKNILTAIEEHSILLCGQEMSNREISTKNVRWNFHHHVFFSWETAIELHRKCMMMEPERKELSNFHSQCIMALISPLIVGGKLIMLKIPLPL